MAKLNKNVDEAKRNPVRQSQIDIRQTQRQKDKQNRILKVAYDMFLQNGYRKTSLQMIVKETGGSLATIYKIFKDKKTLFSETIKEKGQEFVESLNDDFSKITTSKLSLEEYFYLIGMRLLVQIVDKESIAFRRLMIVEGYDNIELMEAFHNHYVENIKKAFLKGLEHYNKTQNLGIKNIEESMLFFANLILHPYLLDSVSWQNFTPPSKGEMEKNIKKGIKIFMLYLQNYKEIENAN